MNKEILFRAKCSGVWRYGSYVHIDKKPIHDCYNAKYRDFIVVNGVYGENHYPITELSSIGQYRGLKDKNGKEIYDGDILYQEQTLLGVVCISARYGISIQKKETTWALRNFIFDSELDTGMLSDIEVRGNVHDNPELLKGGKE